jgi:hypothetical protein
MTSLAVIMTLCMDEICACNECRDERVCSQAFHSNNRLVLISRLQGSHFEHGGRPAALSLSRFSSHITS